MVALRGALRLRRFLRHWRPLWAAGLCAASFATGHMLFGDDGPAGGERSSLLSQYRQATSQMVEETAASREQAAASAQSESRDLKPDVGARRSEIRVQPTETPEPKSEFEGRLLAPAKSRTPAEPSAAHPRTQIQNPQSQMSHLRPAGVQSAKSVSLVEATPITRSESESPAKELSQTHAGATNTKPTVEIAKTASAKPAESAPARKPLKEIARPTAAPSSKPTEHQVVAKVQPTVRILQPTDPSARKSGPAAQTSTVDEENLPPIVPAWAVPRPGAKKRAMAGGAPAGNPPMNGAAQSSMRIELGSPPPRSPATIVLAPGSPAPQTPNAVQPINNPAASPATPVQSPPAKDDQKRSEGLWQRSNDGSPFLKPVTYLSETGAPPANAAGDVPQRLPPIESPQVDAATRQPQEPRLFPMPLEIANPYAAK
jgi:hypothetical protein